MFHGSDALGLITKMKNIVEVESKVFNSEINSVVAIDDDGYGGCHTYLAQKSVGFQDGKTTYQSELLGTQDNISDCMLNGSLLPIEFVKKNEDGTVIAGLQNEELYYICIDRLRKMNAKFPHPKNEEHIFHLKECLRLSKERVEERISRGVMGELKK